MGECLDFPKVIILILNWNGEKNTIECLNSIKKIIYPNYDVIVIDNASIDDSIKKIKAKFPDITIIKNKINLGFSGGFNVGIKKALNNKADYVVCLNNDVIVDKYFLIEFVKIGELRSDIGGLYPMEYCYYQPNKINAAGGRKTNFILDFPIGHGEQDKGQYNKIRQVERICGAAIIVKRKVLLNVGLLDTDFFYGFEDTDISIRINKAGYKIIFVPKSKIWHKRRGATGGRMSPINSYFYTRNYILLARKHAKKITFFFFIIYFLFFNFMFSFVKWLVLKEFSNINAGIKGIIWNISKKLLPSDEEMIKLLS